MLIVRAETSVVSSVIRPRGCFGTKLTSRLLKFNVFPLTLSQTQLYWLLKTPMVSPVFGNCLPLHYEKNQFKLNVLFNQDIAGCDCITARKLFTHKQKSKENTAVTIVIGHV